jgi:glyoxylase-like metal-dependent hydrolase (beta-lactamase superfamily II)
MSTILIDPDSGDMDAYLASLERVRELRCRALLPGHGPPLPGKTLEQLIRHRNEREALIVGALGGAATAALAAIARQAYSDVPEMPAALTERQTLAHLIRLERQGRARPVAPDRSSWTGEGQS